MPGESILILDQEKLTLVSFTMVLEEAGFKCVTAHTLDEARYLTQSVHCAVVDMDFPERELAAFLRQCLPRGNYVGVTVGLFLELPEYYQGCVVILKPLDPKVLVEGVEAMVSRERVVKEPGREVGLSP